jgi:hypothetical protein
MMAMTDRNFYKLEKRIEELTSHLDAIWRRVAELEQQVSHYGPIQLTLRELTERIEMQRTGLGIANAKRLKKRENMERTRQRCKELK